MTLNLGSSSHGYNSDNRGGIGSGAGAAGGTIGTSRVVNDVSRKGRSFSKELNTFFISTPLSLQMISLTGARQL